MPKLTPEMIEKILEEYRIRPVFKDVAKTTGIDERTVKRVVERDRAKGVKSTPFSNMSTPKKADITEERNGAGPSRADATIVNSETATNEARGVAPTASSREEDERLKIIYTKFKAGKKPFDIIADHGYDPEFVETQYRKYLKQKDCDPVEFQSEILKFYDANAKPKLRRYDDDFKKNGCIKPSETIELLDDIAFENAITTLKLMLKDVEIGPPEGWCKLRCTVCGEVHSIAKVFEKAGPLVSGGTIKHLICKPCAIRTSGLPIARS
jgi:hypothetical protein